MTDLRLYDSRLREKREFVPQNRERVLIYVCGPTVYGDAHIGNARPAVVFDILVRLLRHIYPQVVYARNITDIDDKINAKASEEGVDIATIAARYLAQYHADMAALGVSPPDVEPLATDHIVAIQNMIAELLARGHAYEAEGHVLFDTTSDGDYGSLANRNAEEMRDGARVEVAPYKRNPADFVLWKPSSDVQPGWESEFGDGASRGRPGWHIECSAMIREHLGETIDIHGGGADLLFPHHENEAAQSRCAHGAPLANYWVHNGMLTSSGEKMSKSLGNIATINELLGEYRGEVLRLALLQTHYRQTLDFSDDLLEQCNNIVDRLGRIASVKEINPPPADFIAALCDDLNTPQAMAVLFEHLKAGRKREALAAAAFLGILPFDAADNISAETKTEIKTLIGEREAARAAKDFALADELRDKLDALGVAIEDKAGGTIWRVK